MAISWVIVKGFSLIEMMICLGLMGALGSGVVVGLGYWQAHAQMTSQIEWLQQDIFLSQQKARAAESEVVLCASKTGKRCGSDWSAGRLAYTIINGHKEKLFFHQFRIKKAQWQWRSSLGKNDRLIFKPSGDNLGQQGSFYYIPLYYKVTFTRRIIINQLGRVYVRSGQVKEN